ncbi:MAG: alpha/beta fold hydrolase [Nocardioidaceae bacterium]|nr:alpha/beta fold hydrolase [Nocardioidaceae bacterium]NUS51453.1 alpha/beta fold hydrolase [Nocardioidaceae bacterium]
MSDHRRTTYRTPDLVLVEHEVDAPLDHDRPDGPRIMVFAREVADPAGLDKPFLVYLQGGPGSEAPRPTRRPTAPAWLDRALQDYRVLMLDQRGTGRSTPVGALPGMTPRQQADHLALFRADAIVADAELLRLHLGVDRWSVLGQSFGGFTALRYLSAAPEGLREVLFTGGVPPVGRPIDDVYAATYQAMLARNHAYDERYPRDRQRIADLMRRMDAGEVTLPNGDPVGAARFRQVGAALGMSDGAERLHYLLELDEDSPAFRHDLAALLPFGARNPIYALLQEACYADGGRTRWAAERLLPQAFREDRTLLTAEHLTHASLAEDRDLAPLAEATDLLAERSWPRLYDEDALRACRVPCAAAIYANDPYVDRELSLETAALVPTMRTWVDPDHEHNGLRADVGVLDRLLSMVRR